MASMLEKWLVHYDPIHRGWTPGGIANAVCATNGFTFPRVAGGYNLYRRTVGSNDAEIVGAAGANAKSIENFEWAAADVLADVAFELRSIGGGGVESAPSARGVNVKIDAAGEPSALKPNSPQRLKVARRAGGRFEVSWQYFERHEEATPELFRIYSDNSSGVIDYKNPIDEVAYVARQRHFQFVTDPHDHGETYLFAVRAVTVSGEQDDNEFSVEQWADAIPPASPQIVFSEIVEVV